MSTTVCLSASTIGYPEGGGHLWVYLNWALGLRAQGCQVIWLESVRPRPAEELAPASEEAPPTPSAPCCSTGMTCSGTGLTAQSVGIESDPVDLVVRAADPLRGIHSTDPTLLERPPQA